MFARDPPSLLHGEHLGCVGIGSLLTSIYVSERLPVSVFYYIAAYDALDFPRRREATGAVFRHWPALFLRLH
jgi:hypothetical protein